MTILIAGGTGKLGKRLVPTLDGEVRVLTRDPARAQSLAGCEPVQGDLRDPGSLRRATAGVSVVICAVQAGFGSTGGSTPQNVDLKGTLDLIEAAKVEGVRHFILLSIIDAAPDHSQELWRAKYHAEQALKASGLTWTIIRSTAFMEWCLDFVGTPLVDKGRTTVFGRGDNPINFVSANDVAALVRLAVADRDLRDRQVAIAGPENLSFNQVIERITRHTNTSGRVSHVPLPVMRVMSVLMTWLKPGLAREIKAGIFLDTADRTTDCARTRADYPAIPLTSMDTAIAAHLGKGIGSVSK